MSDKNQPAFPSGLIDPSTPEDAVHPLHSGMTLRQYASIKLKVPDSGTDWLDEMINKSLLDDFAAKAMPMVAAEIYAMGQQVHGTTVPALTAKMAYEYADAMLRAREAK